MAASGSFSCVIFLLLCEAGLRREARVATRPAPLQRLHGRSASCSRPLPPHWGHAAVGPGNVITPAPLHAEHVSRV